MTPRTVRKAERAVHLLWALLLALYVYGFLPAWGEPVVRWVVVPGIVGSGFAMWFAAPLRRIAKRIVRTGARPEVAVPPEPSDYSTRCQVSPGYATETLQAASKQSGEHSGISGSNEIVSPSIV
jgi:hypothetical protein